MSVPDFEQIARQLAKDASESGIVDTETVEDITAALRQSWNARAVADLAAIHAAGEELRGATYDAIKNLDR